MPARQPFTALCQMAARPRLAGRADLHLHTVHSDGVYTPHEVVDLARRSGLAAIAVTDHDTLSGVAVARQAAGAHLEVIAGVEITAEFAGRELHLLAYFVQLDAEPLAAALARIRENRVERFREMVRRLRAAGVVLDANDPRTTSAPDALGRRHLAEWLVRSGKAGSVRDAFARYLRDGLPAAAPKKRLPVVEAIGLVRAAKGVASWAHPCADAAFEQLAELRRLGLSAVEVEYPEIRRARNLELRAHAAKLGLAVTGGSDCHGPGPRAIGCCSVSCAELQRLRDMT
jgi:predicted metal-dependent phosphoesterase TrpH